MEAESSPPARVRIMARCLSLSFRTWFHARANAFLRRDGHFSHLCSSVRQDIATHPRILLVDDHVDSVRPMQLFLEAIGYQVTTAHSVATALRAATQEEFDLLVSDIGLPDGSGDDLIRQLQGTGPQITKHRP